MQRELHGQNPELSKGLECGTWCCTAEKNSWSKLEGEKGSPDLGCFGIPVKNLDGSEGSSGMGKPQAGACSRPESWSRKS